MSFLLDSLPARALVDYHSYISKASAWKIIQEKDFVMTLNGGQASLMNFLFLKRNIKQSRFSYIFSLLKKGESITIPIATEKITSIEQFLKNHDKVEAGYTPMPLELDLQSTDLYAFNMDIDAITFHTVNSIETVRILDSLTSTIFLHGSGINSRAIRVLQKGEDKFLKYFLVTERDSNRFIGMCAFLIHNDMSCFYCDGILPAYRNKGFGYLIVLKRLYMLKELGIKKVVVQAVGATSQHIYKKLNFLQKGSIRLYIYDSKRI
ncbi:MAG: acetyltransferase family protein [Candidatus Xenolissoclinum pacificiensis L6]|uniref:Acetyltransferase family protein n=1 Tax=Candidatus Xenolissoclinum pacificiensis L6 TaxID=1401685 RepID=W2V0E7_9RICK|nr:MAG: acetyltransferase family protein [Candidatus Xenolissoclinum pacificiensis L6]